MHYVNFCIALLGMAVLLFAGPARAHATGVSRGEYVVRGDRIEATLMFRADELTGSSTSAADVVAGTRLDADGAACAGALDSTVPDPPDGLRIAAHYTCGHTPLRLHVHAGFLDRLPQGHAHVATFVVGRSRTEHLFVRADPDADVGSPGFLGFVHAGIEHILTGADHLLFLLGLVLLRRDETSNRHEYPSGYRGARRVKAVVFVLTAFTVGHSVSLAVATLGGVAPSARLVEPLVALSVAYVGAENLYARASVMKRRWLVTLPFGLVHGFAFASGLLLVRLPRSELPLALVGFNLGVEIGQLAVMAIVLPLLFLLAHRARAYDLVRVVLSAGVLACGLVWFVQRLL